MALQTMHRGFGYFAGALLLGLVVGCNDTSEHRAAADGQAPETLENIARVLWLNEYEEDKVPSTIQEKIASPANSQAAFGQRTRLFLDDLLQNPDSCSPDYAQRYQTFKRYAEEISPHQAYAIGGLMGPDASRGFREIPPEITFEFPKDDSPDFTYQVGWHFFVGSAYSATGEEFGVQLMFWRYALLPPAMAKAAGLTDLENQVMEIHLAVSRAGDRHYRSKPYVVAGTTGLLQFTEAPFHYRLGNNRIVSRNPNTMFPVDMQAWGLDESRREATEIAVNIGLTQTTGYVLNGDKGLAPSCGGVGTLYYSVPGLQLDPQGSWLQLGDEKIQLASGKFWYDNQYGTGFMPPGNPRSALLRAFTNLQAVETPAAPGGWDWIMMQFDDGTSVGFSALHTTENAAFYHNTDPTPPGTMKAGAQGVFIHADGTYENTKGHIEVQRWIKSDIQYAPYLASHVWYPDRVKVVLDLPVPREVYLVPIVATGQQGYFAAGMQYSEGAVYLEDEAGNRIGRGFLESTGYAKSDEQALKLAGIPVNQDTLDVLKVQTLSPEQQTACGGFVLENLEQLAVEIGQCKGL